MSDTSVSCDLVSFQEQAIGFIEANCSKRGGGGGQIVGDGVTEARAFQSALATAGLAGLTYPAEFGGAGLTKEHQEAFDEISTAWHLPNQALAISHGMCLPMLNQFGTDTQRSTFMPDNISGRTIWCQMFSEPGAGSDVAGLSTRAIRDGDQWVLNGQKVWTSGAHYSDYGIVVARTDPNVPKHQGLSMFIVDVADPAIDVRPLRQISGAEGFNEVFFTDLHIPVDWLLGDLNQGWSLALAMLMFERVSIGTGAGALAGEWQSQRLINLAEQLDQTQDPCVRQGLADLWIRERIKVFVGKRIRDAVSAGKVPGPEGSIAKLNGALLARSIRDVSMQLLGPAGQAWEPEGGTGEQWSNFCLAAAAASIAGGTDEVQRNIIGERVLGLPREPNPFKDVAWEQVPRN